MSLYSEVEWIWCQVCSDLGGRVEGTRRAGLQFMENWLVGGCMRRASPFLYVSR